VKKSSFFFPFSPAGREDWRMCRRGFDGKNTKSRPKATSCNIWNDYGRIKNKEISGKNYFFLTKYLGGSQWVTTNFGFVCDIFQFPFIKRDQ
jgi:hypothetical protein